MGRRGHVHIKEKGEERVKKKNGRRELICKENGMGGRKLV